MLARGSTPADWDSTLTRCTKEKKRTKHYVQVNCLSTFADRIPNWLSPLIVLRRLNKLRGNYASGWREFHSWPRVINATKPRTHTKIVLPKVTRQLVKAVLLANLCPLLVLLHQFFMCTILTPLSQAAKRQYIEPQANTQNQLLTSRVKLIVGHLPPIFARQAMTAQHSLSQSLN